jgi:hypothetical protein
MCILFARNISFQSSSAMQDTVSSCWQVCRDEIARLVAISATVCSCHQVCNEMHQLLSIRRVEQLSWLVNQLLKRLFMDFCGYVMKDTVRTREECGRRGTVRALRNVTVMSHNSRIPTGRGQNEQFSSIFPDEGRFITFFFKKIVSFQILTHSLFMVISLSHVTP